MSYRLPHAHFPFTETAVAFAVLTIIAALYWPAVFGGFVLDDKLCFHDAPWLRQANWLHYVFRDFCDWTNYFRPLTVALLALQVRTFDSTPGPMHIVSLGLHLANSLLVGLLALKVSFAANASRRAPLALASAMLVYGLHPALIEPVDWIGCQYEMVVTLCMLLGLLINATIERAPWRAFGVGTAFFLAACAKESAISFPLLLVLFDLMATRTGRWSPALRSTWQRQSTVYVAVLIAGLAYLILRHWALGYTVLLSGAEPLLSFSRLQKVCLIYLSYWKLILWPMSNIGPIHPFEGQQFRLVTAQSLAVDAAAIAIVLGGAYTFYRRLRLGGLILAVTIALMPVLNLLPIAFNEDLYHDRYATTALAIACALLPSLLIPILAHGRSRVPVTCIALVAGVWLAFAVINIRVTVPLWTDELTLWQWALRENPGSATARNRLLSLYINRGDSPHARALADALIVDNPRCASCMLNAAYAALNDGDAARAQNALDKLKDSDVLVYNSRFLRGYILANGELFELRHDEVGAEAAYRDAIKLEEYDPAPQMALASLLAKQGKILEARAAAEAALPLFTPDERIKRRQEFERGLGNPAPADRP